ELFDPASDSWSQTGSMLVPGAYHHAVLLNDGTVLVTGGTSDEAQGKPIASAEIYDPATGLWSSTGRMTAKRSQFCETVLNDGSVLVAGGVGAQPHGAELYDPVTGGWSATGSMNRPRHNFACT